MSQHFEIVELINQMNKSEPKIEVVAFLVKMEELGLQCQLETAVKKQTLKK